MINFIDYTDFANSEISLEINEYNLATFEKIANNVVYDVLNDLLNAELYNRLIADLDENGKPESEIYINLVNGITYIDKLNNNKNINYKGILEMLRYFVFYEYKLYKISYDATSGTVQSNNENSTVLSTMQLKEYLKKYYVRAVFLYRKVIKFLTDDYLNNEKNYFSDEEYANWLPKKYAIETAISTCTISPIDECNILSKRLFLK
jgi:hypothetical protein